MSVRSAGEGDVGEGGKKSVILVCLGGEFASLGASACCCAVFVPGRLVAVIDSFALFSGTGAGVEDCCEEGKEMEVSSRSGVSIDSFDEGKQLERGVVGVIGISSGGSSWSRASWAMCKSSAQSSGSLGGEKELMVTVAPSASGQGTEVGASEEREEVEASEGR